MLFPCVAHDFSSASTRKGTDGMDILSTSQAYKDFLLVTCLISVQIDVFLMCLKGPQLPGRVSTSISGLTSLPSGNGRLSGASTAGV